MNKSLNIKRFGVLCQLAAVGLVMMLAASCSGLKRGGSGGEVTGVGGSSMAEPTPYGMVLIDRGNIAMGPAADDSVAGIRKNARGVSPRNTRRRVRR